MKIKQILKNTFLGGMLVMGLFVSIATSSSVMAACADNPPTQCCGGVNTSIVTCGQTGGDGATVTDTGLWGVLIIAINILTAGVGIAAIGGIIYGAILYTSAGGSPEQVKKAMGIITNVVIGVVAYALMFAGLNFLIPGGIFN